MNEFMTGAIAMGFAAAALFFFKFWRETHDRLFALFAASLLILSINRIALAVFAEQSEAGKYFYWIRFLAFAMILIAMLDKNRARSDSRAGAGESVTK
jgi:hypothetical protein